MFAKLRTIVLREWACQLPLSWRHSLYLITHVGKLIFFNYYLLKNSQNVLGILQGALLLLLLLLKSTLQNS